MNGIRKSLGAIVVCALAACGGEEGPGQSGGNGGGGGTPPVTTPAPSPTPSPVATISLSADFVLQVQAGLNYTFANPSDPSLSSGYFQNSLVADPAAYELRYDHSEQSARIVAPDGQPTFANGASGDPPPFRVFVNSDASVLSIGWFRPRDYVTAAIYSDAPVPGIVFGQNGFSADSFVLVAGRTSTTTTPIGNDQSPFAYNDQALIYSGTFDAEQQLRAGDATLYVASGTNNVTGSMPIYRTAAATQIFVGILEFTGTLDGFNKVSGTIRTIEGPDYTGTFEGALYGPQRDEIGLAFRFGPSGEQVADHGGIFLGIRD